MPTSATPMPGMPAPEKRVTAVSCGPFANASERKACEHLKNGLQAQQDSGPWVLLTNLSLSTTDRFQSEEIDIVAIGPPGARVIEVKHWTAQYMKDRKTLVEREADGVAGKARKIGTKLRKVVPSLPRADGVFLLTEAPAKVKDLPKKEYKGIGVHTLTEWKASVDFETPAVLSAEQIKRLARALEPRSGVALDGSLRRLGDCIDLKLRTPKDSRFHRIYRGLHAVRQERVWLHLYDLSAESKGADANARREYDVWHRLQEHRWAPRILDSLQSAPGYEGEMRFFTVAQPAAPSIRARASDEAWDTTARLRFAREAVRALAAMHAADDKPLHRNLTPETIRVRHDSAQHGDFPVLDTPLLTSGSEALAAKKQNEAVAPEVRERGLSAADSRSDVYSLCASLRALFRGRQDENSAEALKTLDPGAAQEPQARARLKDLETAFAKLLGEELPAPPAPAARFWSEGQTVPFRSSGYRIVDRLRSDDRGALFKVVEVGASGDDLGTYAARVEYEREAGEEIIAACNLARSHPARHEALAPVVDAAPEWRNNAFTALMAWVDGSPLQEWIGDFSQQEDESMALRWLRTLCAALQALHRGGLSHGGVSPRSIIVTDNGPVLTGCHSVRKLGGRIEVDRPQDPAAAYYPPCGAAGREALASDDIYALAASFFHAFFDREPFLYDDAQDKESGLNWQGLEDADPVLRDFLDKAANADPQHCFASAEQALAALPDAASGDEQPESAARTANEVERLRLLLQSYPGSRWGNRETRGLDSEFAEDTYVETALEKALHEGIRERRIRLAVLCGNAGDGKTALLQHLAERFGLEKQSSSQRILEGTSDDGLAVRMNLDGSAAWQGRTADELLNEFLAPFRNSPPGEDIAHLLAVNDGRLLEWISQDDNETPLAEELESLLEGEAADPDSHIRFVSLNERSLVGNAAAGGSEIETDFLERLLDRLYGGDEDWRPCGRCSAQDRCEVFRAARIFGPPAPAEIRPHARRRLFEALQAVHLRGETHITVRELRAALVYILFGMHSCRDYHDGAADARPYWDRAFDAQSPGRQGEALRELARFDPALEAHPHIDRALQNGQPGREGESLGSVRRRAWFEWTEQQIEEAAGGETDALDLAGGRHLRLFRGLPFASNAELAETCKRLCRGISRLEDLPAQALERTGAALRIVPRTPTETAFWVEKPFERFRLEADLPPLAQGIDRLHRRASLIYSYRDGQEERLTLGADLFHLLLESADGYRLGDVSTNDVFARLSIFVQRLAREGDREMFAWNPMQDEAVYCLAIESGGQGGEDSKQRTVIRPAGEGDQQ